MTVCGIVLFGGKGTRFGSKKQFEILGDYPVCYYSLRAMSESPEINEIVIVCPPEDRAYFVQRTLDWKMDKKITIIDGGELRQDSVKNGIAGTAAEIVVIHDGARPFIRKKYISGLVEALSIYSGATVAISLTDSIKKADSEKVIVSDLEREGLYLIQTPQAFRTDVIRALYQKAEPGRIFTDETQLLLAHGIQSKIIPGESVNIKITFPMDLEMGKVILKHSIGG